MSIQTVINILGQLGSFKSKLIRFRITMIGKMLN